MKIKDLLHVFLEKIPLLNETQRAECLEGLKKGAENGDSGIPPAIAEACPECCPHCAGRKLGKWGFASGIRRWICKGCGKTFNILTGTPLSGLRKKHKWIANAEAMISGKSVRDTAKHCDVHPNTSFRWRHRFLQCHKKSQHTDFKGIAESDATYFYRSEKGSRDLNREPRKRGGDKVSKGISKDLVPVITLRDRSGKGADRVAQSHVQIHALDLYHVHLHDDTLLITGGDSELCAAAKKHNEKAHLKLPAKESRGCGKSPFHTQTTNSFHSNLKSWMRRFNGVATKYLANYVGWHRHRFERTHSNDPNSFILLSFSPLSLCQQLTVT